MKTNALSWVKLARARKYQEDEGYVDNETVREIEIDDAIQIQAQKLADVAGVSFETALNAFAAKAVTEAHERHISPHNN
jgi:hypothetical protein